MPRVTITIPEKTPQPYRFDLLREIVTLGRSLESDIVVGCGSVSGKHAEMRRVKGGYELVDVGSTNGIKVDGIRRQTVVLHTGMTVKLGDVEFGFSLTEEELAELAIEAESLIKQAEKYEGDSLGKEPAEKSLPKDKEDHFKKSKDDDDDDDEEDDDDDDDEKENLPPEKLPPVRLDKRKEKEDQEAEKRRKAERKEREKREAKAKAEREEGKRDRSSKRKDDDEFSESRASGIGAGFLLFTLIVAAGAFFFGAQTRHKKDTGEDLLKGIVNKEDVKKDQAPTEVEDKPETEAE